MEFLLTIIIVVVVVGWVFRKIFPLILAWYIKRKIKDGSGSFGGFSGGVYGDIFNGSNREYGQQKKEEGKVTVKTVEEREKIIEDNVGEYIDFEEEKNI